MALAVATVTAAAGPSAPLPLGLGVVLAAVGVVLGRRRDAPSAVATSSLVTGVALVAVGVRAALTPTGDALDLFLSATGAGFVVVGFGFDERRLVSLGFLQWVVVLARPGTATVPFRHCLVATDLAVPVPQLDGVLLLGLAAVAVGTSQRFWGSRLEAGRGAEVTGLAVLHGALLAKAVELPDLAILCGAGRGIDAGWVVLGMVTAVLTALYGLGGRDPVWTGVGGGALALHGLVATVLSGEPGWAGAALLPLAVSLWRADRAGIAWPRRPGYGRRRPWDRPRS